MKKDRRFFVGLVGVAAVITYLVWTGVTETMVYYLTPAELMERVEADPALHDVGFKVSGHVVPGSYESGSEELLHRFRVEDEDNPEVVLDVEFRHPLPDTFQDDGEVVMEGRYRSDGVFEATEVLTKCGSRYEAMPDEEDYRNGGYGDGGYGDDYDYGDDYEVEGAADADDAGAGDPAGEG